MVNPPLLQPYIETAAELDLICQDLHLCLYDGFLNNPLTIRIVPFCNNVWIITDSGISHYSRLEHFTDVTIDAPYCMIIVSDDRSGELAESSYILREFMTIRDTPDSCLSYINMLLPPVNVPDRASSIKEMIISENGNIATDHISALTGYCSRHINRVFTNSFGYGPKQFCKSIRLAAVITEIIQEPQRSNVDFINNSGYSDQSHFQREFRTFMGETPREFIKRLEKEI